MKKASITGVNGQDGSYLSEFLLSKDYEVHGLIRRASTFNTIRIDHIYIDPHEPNARLFLHYGDLSDSEQITKVDNKYNTIISILAVKLTHPIREVETSLGNLVADAFA